MDFTEITVPTDRVLDIYRFLTETESPESPESPEPSDEWTAEELERFYRESSLATRAILRELAAHPGRELTVQDFRAPVKMATGREYNQRALRGALGAAGRRAKNRHGRKPFKEWWSRERGCKLYRMSASVAKVIAHLAKK